jgi:hypothetical protein
MINSRSPDRARRDGQTTRPQRQRDQSQHQPLRRAVVALPQQPGILDPASMSAAKTSPATPIRPADDRHQHRQRDRSNEYTGFSMRKSHVHQVGTSLNLPLAPGIYR